jgi:hypothetical protein
MLLYVVTTAFQSIKRWIPGYHTVEYLIGIIAVGSVLSSSLSPDAFNSKPPPSPLLHHFHSANHFLRIRTHRTWSQRLMLHTTNVYRVRLRLAVMPRSLCMLAALAILSSRPPMMLVEMRFRVKSGSVRVMVIG